MDNRPVDIDLIDTYLNKMARSCFDSGLKVGKKWGMLLGFNFGCLFCTAMHLLGRWYFG